jgi:hypothetical protein
LQSSIPVPLSAWPAVRRLTADARFQRWCVGMVLLLGLAIRLYAAWVWNGYHPNSPERLIGDELTLREAMLTPGLRRFAWAGLWIGLSTLVRPNLLVLPCALFVVLLITHGSRKALQYGTACALATLLTVGPWVARNYVRYHALFALQTSNAILWQGSPEYYHLVRDQGYTYMQVWRQVIYGPGWQAHDPTSVEGDRWWTARALRSIVREPLIYFRYAAEKLLTYWIGDPNADWGDSYVFNYTALRNSGFRPQDAVSVMVARALPIVALLASIRLWRRWRTLLPIYVLLVYNTLFYAAIHAEARLSEPLQPFLLILIAGAALPLGGAAMRSMRFRLLQLPRQEEAMAFNG